MKILEAQNAVLSNFEVHKHVAEQSARYKQKKRRPPPNSATIMREVLQYMTDKANPLSQKPSTYSPAAIPKLMERLRPYDLSKGELVMILNLRPASVPALNTVIEDMTDRFEYEQQEEIVNIIAEVLGAFPQEAAAEQTAEGGDDVTMEDAAK
ncbi:hypothetical protein NLU13_3489 [Sarocladium strictum]|uniref:DNA-directed RNA polymerase III subunit RPC9 n=1 Tax=Sarocladium strictum TaxID=5046 RepID=A0AA39GMF5_SARSR|nr:hypothetical protein NLU13_3489 [Sarocladium strictum]